MARSRKQLTIPRVLACTALGLAVGAAACGSDEDDQHSIICVRDSTDAGTIDDAGTCPSSVENEEDCPPGCEPIVV